MKKVLFTLIVGFIFVILVCPVAYSQNYWDIQQLEPVVLLPPYWNIGRVIDYEQPAGAGMLGLYDRTGVLTMQPDTHELQGGGYALPSSLGVVEREACPTCDLSVYEWQVTKDQRLAADMQGKFGSGFSIASPEARTYDPYGAMWSWSPDNPWTSGDWPGQRWLIVGYQIFRIPYLSTQYSPISRQAWTNRWFPQYAQLIEESHLLYDPPHGGEPW